MAEWDGKTKGSLLGYRFFVACIRVAGVRPAYFFARLVSFWFYLFAAKPRRALKQFYKEGMQKTSFQAFALSMWAFFRFSQTLIDRVAFTTQRRKFFTYDFDNEVVLRRMVEQNTGGILLSAHLGNWENAGRLIHERITTKINVVMLDEEVAKVKAFLESQDNAGKFAVIAVKNDMSHLIKMHTALRNNEFVAIHADRVMDGKFFELPFLAKRAKFPAGPFVLAKMFKAPVTFVYAVKSSASHYSLSATDPVIASSDRELAESYAAYLEQMVKRWPDQWFNFYPYLC